MKSLFRRGLFFAWHYAKRDGVNRANKELTKNQWLSTQELRVIQQRKRITLLRFAANHVPYYRTLFKNVGICGEGFNSYDEFLRIPFLTKTIIRLEHDRLVSENLSQNGLRADSTSGSTGEALRFFTDMRSIPYRKAAALRSDSFTGWQLGDRVVRLWGAPMDRKLASSLRGKLHGWVTGDRFLSSFDLSPAKMNEYAEAILAFRPYLLVAYPGPLEQFALHCRKREISFPSLKAVVSSAESLWPSQRRIIEDALGAKVFDRYGCREVGQIASECETHQGLHISAERMLVEVVDDDGKECRPGVEGRLVLTDLDNFGMPLIRYEVGDRGALSEKGYCSCGRGLPLLEKVVGRTMDVVRTPDGRQVGGTFWTLLLRSRRGLKQVQVVQNSLDGVVINFVRDPDFDPRVLDYFTARIKECCGHDFQVDFAESESIELTVSGKQRIVVSRLTEADAESSIERS